MARKSNTQEQDVLTTSPTENQEPVEQLTPKQIVQREFKAIVEQRKAKLEKLYQQREAQIEKFDKIKEEKLAEINPKIEELEMQVLHFESVVNPVNDFIDSLEM